MTAQQRRRLALTVLNTRPRKPWAGTKKRAFRSSKETGPYLRQHCSDRLKTAPRLVSAIPGSPSSKGDK